MEDTRKPTGKIDAVSTNSNPLVGYQTAIFDDPVHIFNDPNVLFGSQTIPTNIRVEANDNSPTINGSTLAVQPGMSDDTPNVSINLRR